MSAQAFEFDANERSAKIELIVQSSLSERRVKISFYLHAWQGVLMLLAGIVCVLASFGGYLLSGGGEELLRRALLNVTRGKASYDSLEFNWRAGRIEVSNIRHEDFSWPKEHPVASLAKLSAPHLYVQLEGWPARVASITIDGMSGAQINVSQGFLQEGKLPDSKTPSDLPRIQFVNCDFKVALGSTQPLELGGFRGELIRSEGKLRGGFSLKELNGKPFEFTLETLENGRWVVSGGRIQLDTRATLGASPNPFASKVDPVGLLVQGLFSGELGAEGTLNSMHISVQPATASVAFSCEGEVSYSGLSLKLPGATEKSGEALPSFMRQMLGADEQGGSNLWPRWMQVDRVTTGENGRVAFHMSGGRLEFGCDEGPGSAFTSMRGGATFPPLESLKGVVEADASGSARRILLRGYLGSQMSFETRVERGENNARTYELWVEPRPGDSSRLEFGRPLWRFQSRVKDYYSVKYRPSDLPLAEFEIEATGRKFPRPDWLPPGIIELSGRLSAKGGLYNLNGDAKEGLLLRIEQAQFGDGGRLVFGGKPGRVPGADFHPFWEAFYALYAAEKHWTLSELDLQGEVLARFTPNLQMQNLTLSRWSAASGVLAYRGTLTDFALPELRFSGEYNQAPVTEDKSAAFVLKASDWSAELNGKWTHVQGKAPGGKFEFRELSVPLKLHPQRDELIKTSAAGLGTVSRISKVSVTPEGASVETKGP